MVVNPELFDSLQMIFQGILDALAGAHQNSCSYDVAPDTLTGRLARQSLVGPAASLYPFHRDYPLFSGRSRRNAEMA